MKSPSPVFRLPRAATSTALALGLIAFAACSGDDGAPGAAGITPTTPITPADPLPGVALSIVRVDGGTGPGGNLRAGDRPRVTFVVREGANSTTPGAQIPSSQWALQELLFAGPTSNYQLIKQYSNLATNSVRNADGSWTFTFP
ncbi:MAG: hypothetical protein ABL997_21700, partial [Planctomycetota bacterium]